MSHNSGCCNDDCSDNRKCSCSNECSRCVQGKRGKRGHQGERGHTGPPGPVGLGLLKFSGFALAVPVEGPDPAISFLADAGVGLGGPPIVFAPSYPDAVPRNLRNLAVNVLGYIVPSGGSILVELLKNGAAVPGFSVTYGPGTTGVLTATTAPVLFAIGDTFDLRVTATGLGVSEVPGVDMSATIGVE